MAAYMKSRFQRLLNTQTEVLWKKLLDTLDFLRSNDPKLLKDKQRSYILGSRSFLVHKTVRALPPPTPLNNYFL